MMGVTRSGPQNRETGSATSGEKTRAISIAVLEYHYESRERQVHVGTYCNCPVAHLQDRPNRL